MSEIHHLLNKQVTRWNNERRAMKSLLEKENSEEAARPSEAKPVVTISRQRGCRGREFAKLLSHELQYGFIDKELIHYIADHIGVRAEVVEMLDERDKSCFELNLRELLTGKIFNHDKYIRELTEAVKGCALNGGVVILGRGANYMLNGPFVYRVRLVAPLDYRIKSLMETEGLSGNEAKHEIESVDSERAHFVERYFKHDINNPAEYDMVINTSTHNLNGMAKAVITAMQTQGWGLDRTRNLLRVRKMS